MRKLALILFVLLALESYGVYGAWQVKRVVYTCTLELGPLCYAWEKSAIGKILGDSPSAALEEAIEKSREAWDEQVAERFSRKKDGVKEALDDAAKKAGEALEQLQEEAEEAIEKAKQ